MCAWNERVESGGLFVCPVCLLECNGSFSQAGFDSLKLVISSSSRLRPSPNVPGHDMSHSGWLLFLVITAVVEELLREFHNEYGQSVRLFVLGVVWWVGRRLATTGWRPACSLWMVVLLCGVTIRVGNTGCRSCGVCFRCVCWACMAGVGITGCRFPPYRRVILGVRCCSNLLCGVASAGCWWLSVSFCLCLGIAGWLAVLAICLRSMAVCVWYDCAYWRLAMSWLILSAVLQCVEPRIFSTSYLAVIYLADLPISSKCGRKVRSLTRLKPGGGS